MISEVSIHNSQVAEAELSFLWNSKDLKIHRSVQQQAKSCMLDGVALYHTICTYTLRTYTYICYMAFSTLDLRYTLQYILIRVLYHTKLQTLFTTSSHHCHSSMLTTYCN